MQNVYSDSSAMRRAKRIAAIGFLLAPLALAWSPTLNGNSAKADAALVALPNSLPGDTSQFHATVAPDAATATSQNVSISLKFRNESLLNQLASTMANGRDLQHFLSDTQIRTLFAPSDATVASFKSYFGSKGLTVSYTGPFNELLGLQGTRSQLDAAFATHSVYGVDAKGQAGWVNASALSLPAALAANTSAVAGMVSLGRFHTLAIDGDALHPLGNTIVCSTAPGGTVGGHVFCGFNDPTSYRKAYKAPSFNQYGGQGVKVAVVIWSPPSAALPAWDANYANPAVPANNIFPKTLVSSVSVVGTNVPNSAAVETNLDVTNIHTVAPYASITVYSSDGGLPNGSAGDQTVTIALDQAITSGASIVSNSYGSGCDMGNSPAAATYAALMRLAAVKGVTMVFSSGDSGVVSCGAPPYGFADSPAASPFVTAVGGTTLTQNADYSFKAEEGWSCSQATGIPASPVTAPTSLIYCLQAVAGSSGGGISGYTNAQGYEPPSYQVGVVPNPGTITTPAMYPPLLDPNNPPYFHPVPGGPALAPATFANAGYYNKSRSTPDISDNGDPTTAMVGPTFSGGVPSLRRLGGTSEAAPWFSGIIALAVQKNGGNVGSPNSFLYSHCTSSQSWCYDVTLGFNGSYARPGWDFVTGLGSLYNITAFLNTFVTKGVPAS